MARSASLRKMFTIDDGEEIARAQSERLSSGGSFQEDDQRKISGEEIMTPGVEHTRGELENGHGSHRKASKTRTGLRRGLSVLSNSLLRNISRDDMKR